MRNFIIQSADATNLSCALGLNFEAKLRNGTPRGAPLGPWETSRQGQVQIGETDTPATPHLSRAADW
jgi:hypothetical protein